jgi:uncharacterized protein (TIGR02302 family)
MNQDHPETVLRRFDRKVFWQRLALGFEGLWQALFWPSMVLLAALALIGSGLLSMAPQALRLALVACLLIGFLVSLRDVLKWRAVSTLSAMRHMETVTGTVHRGVSSAGDEIAQELKSPEIADIWLAHKRRQLAGLKNVAVVPPRSRWRDFDPRALRVPLVMLAAAGLLLGRGDLITNFAGASRIGAAPVVVPQVLDAWIKPPSYTGRAPFLLTATSIAERVAKGENITVPANSSFTLRFSGAIAPKLSFLDRAGGVEVAGVETKHEFKDGTLTSEAMIKSPVFISLDDGSSSLGKWPIATTPDAKPEVSVLGQPEFTRKGTFSINWQGKDDYGLKKISAELELADDQADGMGFDSNGIFLFDPPTLKMSLKHPGAKEDKGLSNFDLAAHAWAGTRVTMTLTVTDGAGQEGVSQPITFTLPERTFARPLPRALVEQRKELIFYPDRAIHVAELIDTLNMYPKGLFEGHMPVIAMGAISSRLRNADGYPDVHVAVDELWKLASVLEDGSLKDIKDELQQLKAELEKALRDGAPPERIAELMDKMRKAMDKLMDAMREEAEKRMKDGTLQPGDKNAKNITKEDLQKMMDALEQLSKGGAKDQAQQLLSELDQLLQNLQPGMSQQSGEGESGQGMMKDLGDLMKKQQGLMDDTQRMGPGSKPGQDGNDPNGSGTQQGNGGSGDLSGRQQELRRLLDQLRRGRGGQGGAPNELGDASKSMEGAGRALKDGDKEGALEQQRDALDKMRKGAQALAKQMQKDGQGNTGNKAEDAPGAGDDNDPLGRPRATNRSSSPNKDMLPSELAIRRAREILETLRAKANDRGLSDAEKSYIDRLLRGLY